MQCDIDRVVCLKEDEEIHCLYSADGCICGVANEIMCAFALRVSDRPGTYRFCL
jgi:hypothetical protein